MIYLLSFLAFWLACGFVAAGFAYANAAHDYHADRPEWIPIDRRVSWWVVAAGLLAMAILAINGEVRHGWRKWW